MGRVTNLMATSRHCAALSEMARWNGDVPLKSGAVISVPESHREKSHGEVKNSRDGTGMPTL